ncbi:aldo/keto reductase [Croceicoccus estronivorus]|uniref:aldo/keto reductase n=1 Tax=Croceicoccus estronivorus TaxID=1172626 RepID=UPI000832A4BA|nr:aldo/keto reductase [Croceicoccus estronivorus]OCC24423.1 aldo/keto reductase [Croceicoccus estronivorus]
MDYRRLGSSGLMVSKLAMGTMTFGGKSNFAKVGAVDLETARRHVDICLDAGINLIDTANIYSDGASEEIIGDIFADGKRQDILLATKARFRTGPQINDAGLSRHHLIRACEDSLRRLRTDVIDLYQVHQWDGLTPLEEVVEALDTLIRQGKVRYVGCSNFSAWHIMKALGIAEREMRQRFVSLQLHYSLEAREAEFELMPLSIDQGLGMLIWSPLAGGLLSGKHTRDSGPSPRQLAGWGEPPIYDADHLWDIVDVIRKIAQNRDVSGATVALAWLLARPGVTSVIIGARTETQFADNIAAADLVLDEQEMAMLERVSRKPLPYPYWHQAKTASDRLGPADLAMLSPYLPWPEGQ